MQTEVVGRVTHYYPKIGVAVIELTAPMKVGDRILIRGPATNFQQTVESMQIEHKNVPQAEAGRSIGLKVLQRAREQDTVYRVEPPPTTASRPA